MTVAPALPARTHHAPQTACRGASEDQLPLPGLVPEHEAAHSMPATSKISQHPSLLGRFTDDELARSTAEHTWRALARHLTRSPHMRLARHDRARAKHAYPYDQALSRDLPKRPAALRLYTGGVAWSIALDFDAKGHTGATVADHAAAAAQFFRALGGQVIIDVAPSGGRHVWIPLSLPISLPDAQQLAAACRQLWPSLDTSPLVNLTEGCLTAPGSATTIGGWRTLLTPLPEAITAVTRRSPADLVTRALAQLDTLCPPPAHIPAQRTGGGVRPLSPVHALIAEQGIWPTDRATPAGQPWTRSEACYAVLRAAAARGYTATDVIDRMETGQWNGLLTLYTGRYRWQWRRRFHAEWKKATTTASTNPPQENQSTGGHSSAIAERDHTRRWLAIMLIAIDQLVPGRERHNARALVSGLAWLAWRTNRRYIEAGTRSYSRACGGLLDHTTAGAILRCLRDLPADQSPLQLLSTGRGTHGDLYELVIPDSFAHLATDPTTWPEPRPIPAVFGVRDPHRPGRTLLGSTGWRLHQALTAGATGTATQLAQTAGISRAEAYQVLPVLLSLGLARKDPATASSTGMQWSDGPATAQQAGGVVDADQHLAQLDAHHRTERQQWRDVLTAYAERRNRATDYVPDPGEPLWWPPEWAEAPPAQPEDTPEAAAIALLTEAFSARIIPDEPAACPTPKSPWLRRQKRRIIQR